MRLVRINGYNETLNNMGVRFIGSIRCVEYDLPIGFELVFKNKYKEYKAYVKNKRIIFDFSFNHDTYEDIVTEYEVEFPQSVNIKDFNEIVDFCNNCSLSFKLERI